MKKIFTFMIVAALVAGCSKMDEAVPSSYIITGYSTVETRTDFGTPDSDSNSIPFLWSADDYVFVGGTKSNAIAEGGVSATFTVNGSAPQNGASVYYIRSYPARVGQTAMAYVPAQQSVDKTLGENGDFGYATVQNGSFTLNHATSYFWFDVTGLPSGYTLNSIELSVVGRTVAGYSEWNKTDKTLGTAVDEASSSIELAVNRESVSGEMLAMVVLPTEINSATVTYKLSNGSSTKFYQKELGSRTLEPGHTYKVSVDLDNVTLSDYYLRTLTFEDANARFSSYTLDYVDNYSGREITTWSDLIDDPQYSGPLTYGNNAADAMYYWHDEGNTDLYHMFPDNWGNYCIWGGGHAISNYWGTGWTDEDRDKHIAKYYGQDYVDQWVGNDQMLGWFNVQFMTPVKAHSGDNCVVHYGYKDHGSYIENLPEISFYDDEARVIDHMYVTNTLYTLNQLYNGVKSEAGNTFGGNWEGLTDDAWLKIVAYGFDDVYADAYAEPISEVEFYLVQGENVVTDWQKWDLSGLGAVKKVRFNFLYSDEMGGQHGFTIPGYFAYDDVAVRFEK